MNDWGIPALDLAMAAIDLVAPVTKWGTRRRDRPMGGTWQFYTQDFHFKAVIRHPDVVPATGCKVAVEPNYSTHAGMPRAEALWGIYRKRFLARAWQAMGVRTIVDLDVEPCFRDLALLGVPEGWPSYATRIHKGMGPEVIDEDFYFAQHHSRRRDPLFVVFGGGDPWKDRCRDRGWRWVPEHRQVVSGRHPAFGEVSLG